MQIGKITRRTSKKIFFERLQLGCSNCGWDLDVCDLHHIIHRKDGGSDEPENLSYLCPNCHRLAHAGKLSNLIPVSEYPGKILEEVYFKDCQAKQNLKIERARKIIEKRELRRKGINSAVLALENAKLDFSVRGSIQKASELIGVTPQKTRKWITKNCPHLLIKEKL